MTLLRKLSIATAGASAILSVLSVPVCAFTINLPANANWDILDPLGNLPAGATGTVGLNPVVPGYLAPPAAGATIFSVFGADAVTQFPGWTAASGSALGGILTINEYNARDYVAEPGGPAYSTPRGGVNMLATYTRAATDPTIANLRFIQLFTDNLNGGVRRRIDRAQSDERTDQLPWYFSETARNNYITATTMILDDIPSDPVTIPFNRTVRFETYLATFDNTTKVATIRDGWSWGYDIQAVPEPATLLGTAMALGCGAFFKRKVSTKGKR